MKSFSVKFLCAYCCICLLVPAIEIHTVYAEGNIIVNSTDDTSGTCATTGTGTCTLRDAITFANTQSGADTIVFSDSLSGSTIGLSATLPNIIETLTIDGSLLDSVLTVNGGGNHILTVNGSTSLTINSLTITNGSGDNGGAIFNNGTLTMSNCTVSNSSASHDGGAIYNVSTVTIRDSVISNNTSSITGGAIYNAGTMNIVHSTISSNSSLNVGGGINNTNTLSIDDNSIFSGNVCNGAGGGGIFNNGGTVTINNSTFSGNVSYLDGGGGVYNYNGNLDVNRSTFVSNRGVKYNPNAASGDRNGGGIFTSGISGKNTIIKNSTFSNNTAEAYGGGLYVYSGDVGIYNCTFSGNTAVYYEGGGGLYLREGNIDLVNTIVANSVADTSEGGDCYRYAAAFNTKKNNLIEDSLHSCGIENGVDGNITGSDPVLDSLKDNGGDTETMAMLSGSPAIDAGDDTACHTLGFGDQRNISRGEGDHCDIGAFEHAGGIPKVNSSTPSNGGSVTNPTGLNITFSQDMLHDSSNKAANYASNYLLVERGANNTFDTLSCRNGVQGDDVRVAISSASYAVRTYTSKLTLPRTFRSGTYRLFVCGTSSIWSTDEIVLNNGEDTTIDFTAVAGGSGGGSSSSGSGSGTNLPATGFVPGQVTQLPEQRFTDAYSPMDGLRLQIPALYVDASIVGVPLTTDEWDISWLGNDVGWLNGSAYPTWAGNSVLTGHVWNADNTPGIFVNLKNLQYGDLFEIKTDNQTYTYEVRENKLLSKDDVNTAFKHEDLDWVTLLSCEQYDPDSGTYPLRRMVRAVLVKVE